MGLAVSQDMERKIRMHRLDWKRLGGGLGAWVGLTTVLFACTGDDTATTAKDAGSGDAVSTADVAPGDATGKDAASAGDGPSGDTSAHDSSMADTATASDGGLGDSAASDADATTQPPAPLDLCGLLDSFWGNQVRTAQTSWPATIIDGPSSLLEDGAVNTDPDVGLIGYLDVADCDVGKVFDPTVVDYTAWQDQLVPFEYRFFGCPDDSTEAGTEFALVPPNLYGQPFGPDDLKRLGDWFVASVVQAVANQSANNPSALLTSDQIDQMQAEMAYQETQYAYIVAVPGYHYSTCVDAGSD
jgi:hypothetical protein